MRLENAERRFAKAEAKLNQSVDDADERKRPSYEKPIGCINCPRCMRKMMRVDGIEQALKKKKGKGNSVLSESRHFRETIHDLTKKRSNSNQDLMKKGLNYKFSLKDLPKYSQRLNPKDTEKSERLSRSALSRKRKERGEPGKWEFLRNQCMLSQSDWSKSNLYQLYLKFGTSLLRDPSSTVGG